MLAGISYSDFWQMTIGEIGDVLNAVADKERAETKAKEELINIQTKLENERAAFIAYYSGLFSRPGVPFPETLQEAFPKIFTENTSQPQSWEVTYQLIERKRKQAKKKKEGAAHANN